MTAPRIPGYTAREASLVDDWATLTRSSAADLVPIEALSQVIRHPTAWMTVEESWTRDHDTDGVSTVVISPDARAAALSSPEWSARHLGQFAIVDQSKVELGLEESLGAGVAEFFCQVRHCRSPESLAVELSLPFVWFWDAIRHGNDWFYVDSSGREHPLVRTVVGKDRNYRVEVRALEFRRYLGARDMFGLVQRDHARWVQLARKIGRLDERHTSQWARFTWHAVDETHLPGRTALSRLLGKHLVTGVTAGPHPGWLDPGPALYPEFIIDVDRESGEHLVFTCDPDQLANYYGANPDAPNYLTPVHFDARVLNRYLDEPDRYEVSSTRVSAPGLWSISIGRTSTRDVDAYLGDLGRDLPWQEHEHWRSHNIPPRGRMSEDRYRRDFLGQWAGDLDALDQLRDSYKLVQSASLTRLGASLFRPLTGDDLTDFERLQPPTLDGQRALVKPVLVLSKTLVDAIDSKAIGAFVDGPELKPLALLEALVETLGGDRALVNPLRQLYRLRSGGGLAHLAGESRKKLYADLGILDLTAADTINTLSDRIAVALLAIAELLDPASTQGQGN